MNTKICTSIEQSKKLLSLGLDPSTADMYYIQLMDEDGCYDEAHIWVAETAEEKLQCEAYKTSAWSFAALLELMPDGIQTYKKYNYVRIDITFVHKGIVTGSKRVENKTYIDAAFELVCWLIEQGHIKVNE